MVGPYEHRAPFFAGLPYAAANGGGGLHLEVHVLCAGLDCALKYGGSVGIFGHAACGYERDVGLGEEGVYFFVREGAAVQADFRHLQPLQKFLNLR